MSGQVNKDTWTREQHRVFDASCGLHFAIYHIDIGKMVNPHCVKLAEVPSEFEDLAQNRPQTWKVRSYLGHGLFDRQATG